MTLTNGPNLGLLVDGGQGDPHYQELMKLWRWLDFHGQPVVKQVGLNTPPASPSDGDAYIIGVSPTGAWTGLANRIARWSSVASAWETFSPKQGWVVKDYTSQAEYVWSGAAWTTSSYVDSAVVHKAGVETITALKTFSVGLSIGSASGGNLQPHSTRGLQLSGLAGSSYDLAILNPAESAYYMRVPTGALVPVFPNGVSMSDGNWNIQYNASAGLLIHATAGSAYDLSFANPASTAYYMRVPTGTNTPNFPSGINLGGTANLSAYDEGTWTPTATNLGGSGITYSTKWVRVGNRIDFTIDVNGVGLSATAGVTSISLSHTPVRNTSVSCSNNANGIGLAGASCGAPGKVYPPTLSGLGSFNISGTFFLT